MHKLFLFWFSECRHNMLRQEIMPVSVAILGTHEYIPKAILARLEGGKDSLGLCEEKCCG